MIRHFFTKQFLKFLFVGATAAAGNWVARIIFNLWMSFSASVIAAYLVGMTVAFMLNKIFVFPNSSTSLQKQIRDFTLTNFVAFWLVLGTSIALKNIFENLGMKLYSAELAHLIAISLPMIGSFLIYKFFAFKEKDND